MSSKIDLSKYGLDTPKKQLEMARACEAAERYEDMCAVMKHLIETKKGASVTTEERNLLSVAYKNVVGAKRASWRTLTSEEYKDNKVIEDYRKKIEQELAGTCQEILDLLKNFLISACKGKNDESEVFYLKMSGDYSRYLAEFLDTGDNQNSNGKKAADFYEAAYKIATDNLSSTHPIRLGLALNFSVCYYECLKDHKKACDLAKKAFDEAISKLDQLDESSYKDSTLIMQLLRDNLTLWTEGDNQEEDGS